MRYPDIAALCLCAMLHGAEGFVGGHGLAVAGLRATWPALARQPRFAPIMAMRRPAPGKASRLPKSDRNVDDARDMSETLSSEIELSDDRKRAVEACLGRYNAVYTMLWKRCPDTGSYKVIGHYSTDARKRYGGLILARNTGHCAKRREGGETSDFLRVNQGLAQCAWGRQDFRVRVSQARERPHPCLMDKVPCCTALSYTCAIMLTCA
jgi:hypothetical protein